MPYFNYTIHAVGAESAGRWELRDFVHAWWTIAGDDNRWTPPEYSRLRHEIDPRRNGHLSRLGIEFIRIEALHRTGLRRSRTDQQEIPLTSIFERSLAAAVAVIDPRRRGQTAHLALPQLANDAEAFDRLYYYLIEALSERGYHRIVAPVGLSPHLDSGWLVDSWNDWPPLHTPGNPPYLPELVERRLRPLQTGRLYRAEVIGAPSEPPPGPATVRLFDPWRLTGDLLPLLVAATENPAAGFPPPDAAEAALLLRLLRPETLTGFLAEVNGQPAGFVLLGADTADRLRRAWGGRPLWGQALLRLGARFSRPRGIADGRLYFGAVLPAWRRRGVGGQLWDYALRQASGQGWRSLGVGPVWLPPGGESPAAAFLASRSATARQTYRLYERSF
jgi:ribosomal protein S18 acetylase RimI-like enzyme